MKSHLEIEAKYDVSNAQVLPDLIGVGGVVAVVAQAERVLTAVYFDTPGHDLGAAGVTLRRRTGGTDDGWHLKLTLARGERLELHRPLGVRPSPPAALRALVRAFVRSSPLAAVATLTNRRTVHQLLGGDGRVLAELADDSVTGERHDVASEAMVWREVEVELVEGDREVLAALDAAVRKGGAVPAAGASKVGRVLGSAPVRAGGRPRPRTPVGEVVDAVLRQAVLDVLAADPLVRLDRLGAASRLAGALRRLGAVLAVHRRVAPPETSPSIRDELAWLTAVVAEVADLDAVRLRLREALAGQPVELVLNPVRRRIDRELAVARRTALADVRSALSSARYLDLVQRLVDWRTSPSAASARAGDVLPEIAASELRRVQRQLAPVCRPPLLSALSTDAQHGQLALADRAVARAREAVLTAGAKGSADDGVSQQLVGLSFVVADLRTSARSQDMLWDMAMRAHAAGENSFTLGRLHALEQFRARELHRRLRLLRKQLRRHRES